MDPAAVLELLTQVSMIPFLGNRRMTTLMEASETDISAVKSSLKRDENVQLVKKALKVYEHAEILRTAFNQSAIAAAPAAPPPPPQRGPTARAAATRTSWRAPAAGAAARAQDDEEGMFAIVPFIATLPPAAAAPAPSKIGGYFGGYQLTTFNPMSLVGVPRVWVVHFGYIFKALRFILTFGPLLIAYAAVFYVAFAIMYFASNPRL